MTARASVKRDLRVCRIDDLRLPTSACFRPGIAVVKSRAEHQVLGHAD